MDRRQTTDPRRLNQERRKDAETRAVFDVIHKLMNDHTELLRCWGDCDSYDYKLRIRREIEEAAKKIRVIQEKESHVENVSV